MAKSKQVSGIEPVVTEGNLNVTAPILLASMMVTIIAMVASAVSDFS